MGFFKKKSEKELKAELATLRSKEKARVERKKLKKEIFELKYGKLVSGAKEAGKGAGKVFDWMIPPQKAIKKRKGKRRRKDDFLGFDIGF